MNKSESIQTYSMSVELENIQFNFPQGTGATLYLEWKLSKHKHGKLQRTVCETQKST